MILDKLTNVSTRLLGTIEYVCIGYPEHVLEIQYNLQLYKYTVKFL